MECQPKSKPGCDSGTERQSQTVNAYRQLRGLILGGELSGAPYWLEAELADRLGMSRTPVREAMVRLQQDGIVEIRPRHGMRIRPVSPDDMREIYQVLTSLEGAAAELVARQGVSPGQLAALKAAVARMDAALDADDLAGWADADETFHRHLVAYCGNRRLMRTVEQFWAQAHRARLMTLRLRP